MLQKKQSIRGDSWMWPGHHPGIHRALEPQSKSWVLLKPRIVFWDIRQRYPANRLNHWWLNHNMMTLRWRKLSSKWYAPNVSYFGPCWCLHCRPMKTTMSSLASKKKPFEIVSFVTDSLCKSPISIASYLLVNSPSHYFKTETSIILPCIETYHLLSYSQLCMTTMGGMSKVLYWITSLVVIQQPLYLQGLMALYPSFF